MRPWPGHAYPLGATYDGSGTNFAIFSEVAREGGAVPVQPARQGDARPAHRGRRVRLARLPAQRRAGPALRLPGARALRPRAGPALQPAQAADRPVRQGRGRPGACGTRRCSATRSATRTARNDADSAPFVPKSVVVNPFFDWGTDRAPRIPYHETVIYEAHVRGPDDRPPGDPAGAARHLHRARPPGDDRAPQDGSASPRWSSCRCTSSSTTTTCRRRA